jgi:hypothetical protein
VLAAVDRVLADVGEEGADVRSMLQLRIDGGGGSPDLTAVNSRLASSWTPATACAGRWWCRSHGVVNRRCAWKRGNLTNRSLGSCLFVPFPSRVLYVKGIVIFYFI